MFQNLNWEECLLKKCLPVLEKSRKLRDGRDMLIQLIPNIPFPADSFIPEKDKVLLLLRFQLSKREYKTSMASLTNAFAPSFPYPLNPDLVSVNYRKQKYDNSQWFIAEYHCFADSYGITIYRTLKYKLFP